MAKNKEKRRFAVTRALAVGTIGLTGAVVFLGLSTGPASGSALGVMSGPFVTHNSDSQPYDLAEGPDGNMWFTGRSGNEIGRVSPSGSVAEFPLPAGSLPAGITTGPNDRLWFAESGSREIASISTVGAIIQYGGLTGEPQGITTGPDGNLWFTEPAADRIGTMNPDGSLHEYALLSGSDPVGIAGGPDGALWFTEGSGNRIGTVTLSGQVTTYSSGLSLASQPFAITLGPDGNLWFTEKVGAKIGRITPQGSISEFPIPTSASAPEGIAPGPDGNIWFTESATSKVGRITPSGTFVEYPVFADGATPVGIASGADGNLWFGDGTDQIESIGANVPGALVLGPLVAGSSEVTTAQSCVGDRWSDWAGAQPGPAAYTWELNGVVVGGASGESYVPAAGDAGAALSCTVTVSYALVGVTVSASSAPVVLGVLSTGPTGAAGAPGAAGVAGTIGQSGVPGTAGADGKVELVTCQAKPVSETVGGKVVKVTATVCTTKVVTRTVTFTTTTAKVTVFRGNKLVAIGVGARLGRRAEILVSLPSALSKGRYVLRLGNDRLSVRVLVAHVLEPNGGSRPASP